MSNSYFEYKCYAGTIKPNVECGNLFGKIAFIRDLVTYEADTIEELEYEFRFSVDGYLADCEDVGKSPDKPSQTP